jgi:hypothetical protein
MSDERALKSSYELAMERFKKRDSEAGVERLPLSDSQKAAIAEIRNFYEAKLAEVEVLYQGHVRAMADPAAREARDEEYRRDRDRLTADRDAKIERARQSTA